MRIYIKEKDWIDQNVKKRFAIIPFRSNSEEIVWLEWYYYYEDGRFYWKAPCKNFLSKADFLERRRGK